LATGLAALLIEGLLVCPHSDLPVEDPQTGWTRRITRGQNLDRTGLSPRQVQVISALESVPCRSQDLASQLNIPGEELLRILHGLQLADWIQSQAIIQKRQVFALEPDLKGSHILRQLLGAEDSPWTGKVVRDQFGLQLLLKRGQPDVVMIPMDQAENFQSAVPSAAVCLIADSGEGMDAPSGVPVLHRPYSADDALEIFARAAVRGTAGHLHNKCREQSAEAVLAIRKE
jgi:hypothetical protein